MENDNRIEISSQRYRWALHRAGLTEDSYMNSHPKSDLRLWLLDEKRPTAKQLEDFAKSVNIPLGYLFLDEIPQEKIPFPVFRGNAGRYDHFDLNVYDTVSAVEQRQSWLEDYLIENDIDTCQLIGIVTHKTSVQEAVERLRRVLNLEPRWAFSLTTPDAAVSKMTEMMEYAGIFVAFNGVVGNNTHRPIRVSECRGFALVNKIAPYVFVNSQDAKSAQLFTLVHETAHLMLGVSAGHAEALFPADDLDERYCDMVAAEFLVPAAVLREIWNGNFKHMSRRFKVSELVVARRAHELGLISDAVYREFWQEYQNRPIVVKNSSAGGSFYMTSVKRIGHLFALHVRNAVNSRQLSYTQAYRLTGLYGKTYDHFMANSL